MKLFKIFKAVFQDLMLVAAFLSIVYGVSLLNVPAAFIIAGILLLCASIPKEGNRTQPGNKG